MINRQKLIYFAVIYTSATIYVQLNAHISLRLMIYSSDFFRRGSRRLDLGLPSEGRHTLRKKYLNETNCFILQTTFDEKKKLNTQKRKARNNPPQEMWPFSPCSTFFNRQADSWRMKKMTTKMMIDMTMVSIRAQWDWPRRPKIKILRPLL